MSGTTLSGTYLVPVVLTDGATQNPATISPTGTVSTSGTALLGSAGAIWTVTNYGLIEGSGTAGSGVVLAGGGTVSNASFGSITGTVYGISFGAGGTAVNAGLISGGLYGISFAADGVVINQSGGSVFGLGHAVDFHGSGTIANYGTLSAGTNHATVLLQDGGVATNAADGLIEGSGGTDIYITGATGTVVNAGMISASASANGVNLHMGGAITNATGGTINAAQRSAIYIAGGPGTVANAGVILSTLSTAVVLEAGGTLTNAGGGSITGNFGVYAKTGAARILNAGVIEALTTGGNAIDLLLGGYVSNGASGIIEGLVRSGVFVSGASGTVLNAGLIASAGTGGNGVALLSGGYISNAATGTISAPRHAGIYVSGAVGTVENTGIISSTTASGVDLNDGGAVTNQSGGTISGNYGVFVTKAGGAVVNAGLIESTRFGAGIALLSGGVVTNDASGTISAWNFVALYAANAAGTIVNAGSIMGGDEGIALAAGGSVTNTMGGVIAGGIRGVVLGGAVATLVNDGNIVGSSGGGVDLDGGSVTNAAAASITGVYGVSVYGDALSGGTLTNAGTIVGTDGTAVAFIGTAADLLVIDPGAVFSGVVLASAVATSSTLELASGVSAGTLAGLGSQYQYFTQSTIDAGAMWTLTGANTLAADASLMNSGTLALDHAALYDFATLTNNGAIQLDPSTMTVAGLVGTGTVTIEAGSTLDVQGTISSGETIEFAGSGAYLELGSPGSVAGSVTGFALGETIDLKGIAPGSVSYSEGELQFNGSAAFPLTLDAGNTLQIEASDDGTELTALCFCAGTRIATPNGDVPVEKLKPGQLVLTLDGRRLPLRWIGTGQSLLRPGRRTAATPVIVRRGALADGVPGRDLRITKGHSLYLDGVLVPVENLVNHRTILWDDKARVAQVYHLELDTHEVLLANNAPAESYRDDGNRALFQNVNPAWDNYQPLIPYAPIVTNGSVVEALWQRLLARAKPRRPIALTEEPDLHLLVGGARVEPLVARQGIYAFEVPAAAAELRIGSRCGVPSELGVNADQRRLGVAVRRIVLRQPGMKMEIDAGADLLDEGFHLYEPGGGFRWTDGAALLPSRIFGAFAGDCPLTVEVHVGCTARYAVPARPKTRKHRSVRAVGTMRRSPAEATQLPRAA